MSSTTLVSFIRVKDSSGNVQDRYQNGKRENMNALDNGSGTYVQHSENIVQLDGENYFQLELGILQKKQIFIYQKLL